MPIYDTANILPIWKGVVYMQKLWSRKEVCSELGISMRTLCRKLKELDIVCVGETMPNNVTSMKISNDDYLRLAAEFKRPDDTIRPDNISNEVAIYGLKVELMQTHITLDNALKTIEKLESEKTKAEEKNEALFNAFTEVNNSHINALQQINELQSKLLQEKSKGLFARIFKK